MPRSLAILALVISIVTSACGDDNSTSSASAGRSGAAAAAGGTNSSTGPKGGAAAGISGRSNSGGSVPGGSNAGAMTAGGSNAAGGASGANHSGGAIAGGGNNGGSNPNTAAAGSGSSGGTTPDGSNTAGSSDTAGSGNSGGANAAGTSNTGGSTGFAIRIPASHQLTCLSGTFAVNDTDWICTLDHGAVHGLIYVQSTPTACEPTLWGSPIFSSSVAQISLGGAIETLQNAAYDWGGNHHNDMLSFTFGGIGYTYYHSSFGYGWRACHNMDCLQVSAGATGAVTSDGCTKDRTIPVVCSLIEADGTYDPLSSDPFTWCPGDANH